MGMGDLTPQEVLLHQSERKGNGTRKEGPRGQVQGTRKSLGSLSPSALSSNPLVPRTPDWADTAPAHSHT